MRKRYWKLWCLGIAFMSCGGVMALQANESTIIAACPAVEECPKPEPSKCCCYDNNRPILEFRASYFFPFSKIVRDLVHSGGANIALEATIPVWRKLNVWTGIDYFSRSGRMTDIDASVHLTIVPVTVGLKYIYPLRQYYGIYGGAGVRYYFVEMVNRLEPIYRTVHRSGVGGIIEIGNMFYIGEHFVIDIFTAFSFTKVNGIGGDLPPNATSTSIDVGGWNIGAGLGYKF